MQDVVIEPGGTTRQHWRDLWRYRELLYFLAWRDILVRYKQTVAGARIETLTYPWRSSSLLNVAQQDVSVPGPSTRAARDGTFAIRLGRGACVSLRVAAEGLSTLELPRVLAGERLRVVLRPGVRLVVAVLDATGAPAAGAPVVGATVRLFNNADHDGTPTIRANGVSAADGTCVFESLPPSAW